MRSRGAEPDARRYLVTGLYAGSASVTVRMLIAERRPPHLAFLVP
jgi:hypothetical protein